MGKPRLRTLAPRVQELQPRLRSLPRDSGTKRMRGYAWMKRRARWLREHPLCCYCEQGGRVTAATEVDHVKPLIDGGADDEANFASTCTPCHIDKTRREAQERGGRR